MWFWKCTGFGSCIHVCGFGSVQVLEVVYMYVVWKLYTCTCLGRNMVSTYQTWAWDTVLHVPIKYISFPGTINTHRFGIIKGH